MLAIRFGGAVVFRARARHVALPGGVSGGRGRCELPDDQDRGRLPRALPRPPANAGAGCVRHRVIPAPATDANHVRIVSSVAGNFGSNRRGKPRPRPERITKTKTVLFLRAGGSDDAIAFASFPRRASHPKHPRTVFSFTPLSTARTSQPLTTWTAGTTPRRPRGTRLVRSPHRVAWRFGPPPRACCPTRGPDQVQLQPHLGKPEGLSFGSSSSSGIIADHWRRTRGAATTEALGPGVLRDARARPLREPDRGRDRPARAEGAEPPLDGRPPRRVPRAAAEPGTAAFAARTHRKQPAGRMAAAGGTAAIAGRGRTR